MCWPSGSVTAKVDRAKKHVQYLDAALGAFYNSKPYRIGTKRNPETRQLIYYVASVEDVPMEIATIAGDAIHNLHAALDHLAHHLVSVGRGNDGPHRYAEYPIFESASKYKANKRGKVHGIRKEALKAIDATNPYKGGNDLFWQLQELDNTDKHRLLLTVGGSFGAVDVSRTMLRGMLPLLSDRPGFDPASFGASFPAILIRPADRLFPLKSGDELFIDAADAEPDDKMKFRLEVAISEPGIVEGEPLLKTVQDMLDLVGNLVPVFAPLLV